jgi:hypothetical protein
MKKHKIELSNIFPVWHDKLGFDKSNQTKIICVSRIKFQTNTHKVREINFKPIY